MPFEPPAKRIIYKDRSAGGGAVEIATLVGIKEHTGLYDFTFDDSDLKALRDSLLQSLRSSPGASVVNDVPVTPTARATGCWFLLIGFDEVGIVQRGTFGFFSAVVKGSVRVEDDKGAVLREAILAPDTETAWTIGGAKDNAIRNVVAQVGELLVATRKG